MPATVHVFVSSTWLDLRPEREKVEEVLANFRETKFIGMEYFGSRDESTCQASLDEVERSELYLGILGGRHGSGITRQEYDRAHQLGLPCFFYLKDDAAVGPGERDADDAASALLVQFKTEVRGRHLIRATFSNPDQLATQVAIDLHRWLFDKWLEPLLRRAGEDAGARAAARDLLAEVKDLGAVSAFTHRALQAAQLLPSLDRTQALVRYEFLTEDCYDFRGLIEREIRWYVGRVQIFDELRRFSTNPGGSGYFCLIADAGLGKTALAAEIAGRFDAPAFFCSTSEGLTTAQQCLRHLCAELILRHGLDHDHLPDSAGRDPGFLVKLLGQAAAKAQGPLWLVVDGLDEADDPERGRNPLLLPASLPPNIYVVITQRPAVRLTTQPGTRLVERAIYWDDPGQAADIEAHLARQAQRPEVAAALGAATPPLATEAFVASLRGAAQGNFKYLDYVLTDIVDGAPGYRPLDVTGLPPGLERYYEQFWARMGMERMIIQAWDDWYSLFRPVVALLGVAAEPVTVEWIATHAGRDAGEIRARVLLPWRRFLAARGRASNETWHIVHKSFADFLRTKPELELETFNAHIADYYLADPARWGRHRGYASRHLAAHLQAAGDSERLAALLVRREWYDAQLALDPGSGLFADDIRHTWAAAQSIDLKAAAAGARPPHLAREAGCAMTTATVNSLSSNLRPGLLVQLVKRGGWAPATALTAIARNPDPDERARALTALAPELPDTATVRRALSMVRGMRTGLDGNAPLRALIARLSVLAGAQEALAEADRLDSNEARATALAAACPHLDEAAWRTAFDRLFAIVAEEDKRPGAGDREWHVRAGIEMLAHLPRELIDAAAKAIDRDIQVAWARSRLKAALAVRLAVLDDTRAIQRMRLVENDDYRVDGYAAALPHLRPEVRAEVVSVALEAAVAAVEDLPIKPRTAALAAIARYAPPEPARRALQRALAKILPGAGLDDGTAMEGVAPMLDADTLRTAIAAVKEWNSDYDRGKALTALACRAIEVWGPERALAIVASIGDSYDNAEALIGFLPQLARQGHTAAALEATRRIGRDEFRPQALAVIAPFLSRGEIAEGLTIAQQLPDRAGWTHAAGALSERLAALGEPAAALGLVQALRDGAHSLPSVLAGCARAAAEAGDSDAAITIARQIDDTDKRARIYELLAADLANEALATAAADMIDAHNASHHTNAWGESFWSLATGGALDALLPRVAAADPAGALALAAALEDESARAAFVLRAADALSPLGREDLQLAALKTLRDALLSRHWRASWMVEAVAPSLAEAALREVLGLVEESLRQAGTERNHGTDTLLSQAAALLTRLARLGHPGEAMQRFARIDLSDHPAKLASFLDALPSEQRGPWLDAILTSLETTGWDHTRETGLVALAPLLPAVHLERALAIAQRIQEASSRCVAAGAIMQRWSALTSADAALERATALGDTAVLGGALWAVSQALAGPGLERALRATAGIPADYWSERAYAAMARRAAECGMQERALELAVQARTHAGQVIEAMAPYLNAEGVETALRHLDRTYVGDEARARVALIGRCAAIGDPQTALALAHALSRPEDRARALFQLARAVGQSDPAALYGVWRGALQAVATRNREDAMEEIAALAPLAGRIGGAPALLELARAARAVIETWP